MNKLLTCLLSLLSVFCYAQTRDSIFPVTVSVSHDSIVTAKHDSTYMDTIQVPVLPPAPVVLKGMYLHPNQVTIGNSTSENSYLTWIKNEGGNMLNCYARSYLYDETKRTQLAAFVKKAKENYGIILVTVDVRFSDSRELPGWQAYFLKYGTGISGIEPLTEKEPWINSGSGYDYAGTFTLLRTMGNLCNQYGAKLNFYVGWMGNNYNGLSFSQAPVDSMVKYCGRIFISNYISVSDYYSTSTSLGKWDNRMDKRCAAIAVACPKFGKPSMDIVEIISLERKVWGASSDFLGTVFACPTTTTNKCHSFYGTTYTDALNAYNNFSTTAVLQYTNVIGRTMFYDKYGKLCAH